MNAHRCQAIDPAEKDVNRGERALAPAGTIKADRQRRGGKCRRHESGHAEGPRKNVSSL